MIKKLKIVFLGACLFLAGYLREFVFESINFRLASLQSTEYNYDLTFFLTPLNTWTYNYLYGFKYFLTFLFALIFLGLSLILVKLVFNKKEYLKITVLFFTAIFILSFMLFGVGFLIGKLAEGYTISRYIIEFIESPLAPFFLISAMHLHKKSVN